MESRQHGVRRNTPTWLKGESNDYRFFDVRLARRMQELSTQLWEHRDQSIPIACQNWANTKTAYRFLGNDRVHEYVILEGHFHSTRDRVRATSGPVLILHNTTTFSFQRDNAVSVGITHQSFVGKDAQGRPASRTICGLLMHSSLAVTLEGMPLGLAAVKFWNRQQFKGCSILKRHVNPTRVPIETKESFRWLANLKHATTLIGDPARCVHVGDREADIYASFCLALELDTHFLVRAYADRLVGDDRQTIADEMGEVRVKGLHRVEVHDAHGKPSMAVLELRYKQVPRVRCHAGRRLAIADTAHRRH